MSQDGAADHRAEDRAEQRGQRDVGDEPAQRLAARGLEDERGQQRKHEAAADALDDTPADERAGVPRQAGPDRPDQERSRPNRLISKVVIWAPGPSSMSTVTDCPDSAATTACAMTMVSPRSFDCLLRSSIGDPLIR